MTVASSLVDWAWDLGADDVPPDVESAVGRHLIDGLGTLIAAGRTGAARPAVTVALGLGGPPEAPVPGTGTAVSAPAAALAIGTLVHALDFDDTHAGGLVHATAVVLPTALAVGHATGASGREVLAAAVAGYEAACRLAAAAPHGFHRRGLHATAAVGTLVSALVAARLARLSRETAVHALGIAGSSSGGLLEFLSTGASTKQLHPGLASHAGIVAARLAAAGAEGPASVLEGRQGVYATLTEGPVDARSVLSGLGQTWECTRITIKPYPACQLSHAALDAAGEVLRQLGDERVAPGDVVDVDVQLHPDSAAIVAEPAAEKVQPWTAYEAKFSVQWSVAAMLVDGALTVGSYSSGSLLRRDVGALARRVGTTRSGASGPAADAPGAVVVRLVDGRQVRGSVPCSAGGPRRPLDDDALLAKVASNAGGESAELFELVSRVQRLRHQPDLCRLVELTDLLARPTAEMDEESR